jgi:hypothetical protein
MKSSFNRDNNYCHYVIQRIAGFAITLYYHPAGLTFISTYILKNFNLFENSMHGFSLVFSHHFFAYFNIENLLLLEQGTHQQKKVGGHSQ